MFWFDFSSSMEVLGIVDCEVDDIDSAAGLLVEPNESPFGLYFILACKKEGPLLADFAFYC